MRDPLPSVTSRTRRSALRRLPLSTFCMLVLALTLPLLGNFDLAAQLSPVTATVIKIDPPTGMRAHGAPVASAGLGVSLNVQSSEPPVFGRSRHESFYSPSLGRAMSYWIYLPPSYRATEQRYPVLYMLHGLNGSDQQWKDMGLFDQADALIRARQIAPLIIVTPQGDNGYWMNHIDGGPRWADYVTRDLIPQIDQSYRTLADGPHRAIGGLSMGGHGAIQLALNNPGLFDVVGGHSAVFRSETEAFPFFGTGAEYQRRDPVSLVQQGLPTPFALWLDNGALDPWLPRTHYFHELLLARGAAHSWQLDDGDHSQDYWQPRIPLYLAWYDQQLRSGGIAAP